MIQKVGQKLSAFSERFVPDPFVFALLLTFITFVIAIFAGENFRGVETTRRLTELGNGWFTEFTNKGLLKFAFQMCVVLLTGHAIAMSGAVRGLIERLAKIAKTPSVAVAVVAFVACVASLIQWGLGAIVGAFMAREVGRAFAREGRPIHYPLLGAAGYAGFLVWHGGLSGSAPLEVAKPDHFLVSQIGVISISETILSPLNISVTIFMLICIPLLFWRMMPSDPADMIPFSGDLVDAAPDENKEGRAGFVGILESTWLLNGIATAMISAYLIYVFVDRGAKGWNLDTVNLLFLGASIALHRSPDAYIRVIADGVRGCAGIIVQFPLYFGVLGLLKASGLIHQISAGFVAISSKETIELFTFLSAGIVNFFVPSGGGQWAVQGPVMMDAAIRLGVDPSSVIMALSYGDAWTNMLQPFWALPLLGIMSLRARDIVGYTAVAMLATGPVFLILLAAF